MRMFLMSHGPRGDSQSSWAIKTLWWVNMHVVYNAPSAGSRCVLD
jgi:hypothetical protein